MITINAVIPEGFVATGEYRQARLGEYYLYCDNVNECHCEETEGHYIILKKRELSPEDLEIIDSKGYRFDAYRMPKAGEHVYVTAFKTIARVNAGVPRMPGFVLVPKQRYMTCEEMFGFITNNNKGLVIRRKDNGIWKLPFLLLTNNLTPEDYEYAYIDENGMLYSGPFEFKKDV